MLSVLNQLPHPIEGSNNTAPDISGFLDLRLKMRNSAMSGGGGGSGAEGRMGFGPGSALAGGSFPDEVAESLHAAAAAAVAANASNAAAPFSRDASTHGHPVTTTTQLAAAAFAAAAAAAVGGSQHPTGKGVAYLLLLDKFFASDKILSTKSSRRWWKSRRLVYFRRLDRIYRVPSRNPFPEIQQQ